MKKKYNQQSYSRDFQYVEREFIPRHLDPYFFLIIAGMIFMTILSWGVWIGTSKTIKMWPEPLKIERIEYKNVADSSYYAIDFASYGVASYYDYVLDSGWSSKGHFVCASRDFERGVTLLVTNLENQKQTACLTTDYGPDKKIHPDRIIDLSSTAFSEVGSLRIGLFQAKVELACKENCVKLMRNSINNNN